MADYKRMISYMYQYENGVKRKNVGFARIEAKNGQCKITLHMQLLGQLDSIFPTYLIQRDDNDMELIYLGDAVLKNQVMDSKLTANENNIMESGYQLSDMGGLLLFLNDYIFFATEWDDKPIVAREVLEALKPKDKRNLREANTGKEEDPTLNITPVTEKSEESKESLLAETETADREAGAEYANIEVNKDTPILGNLADSGTERGSSTMAAAMMEEELTPSQEAMIPKYKLPRGWKTIERLQYPRSVSENKKADSNLEAADIDLAKVFNVDGMYQPEYEDEQKEPEVMLPEDHGDRIDQEIGFDRKDYFDREDTEYSDLPEESCEEENDYPGSDERSVEDEQPEHPTAQSFFDHYPRIYPFEDSEIILCVKIEPKDLGSLPKELWTLSNNSFLMHGFYCYHHLIFAKMKDRFGCRYILGIPGIYHNRERFMARMFGFESFKSIRKRELRQGDFGYWYLPVNF